MNNLDKPRSAGNRITLEGDTITIGETKFPIQQIRYVDVAFRLPGRFLVFTLIGFAVFALMVISMFGLGTLSIFWGNADSPTIDWALGLIFFVGGALFFGTLIFAMIAYPIEWRVEVITTQGANVVQVERSRTRAVIFANRIKRLLPNYKIPFE